MNNTSVFGANDEYVQQTKEYGRIDALFALLLYVFMMPIFFLLGKMFLQKGSDMTETYIFCATGIASLVPIGFVFLLCLIRKQKLITVGFSKTHALKSFGMGMALSMGVIIYKVISAVVTGSAIKTNIALIVIKIIYYLIFVSFMEEFVIRGYIGTRLFGFFTNKRLSIVIVGNMFSLYHIPFHMTVVQMDLLEYISFAWWNLICIFVIGLFLQWLYSKYNSIIAPTIFHFIWDFIQWFIP